MLFSERRRTPSSDEERAIYGAAIWAAKQLDIKPGDSRLRYSLMLWVYSSYFNSTGSIPVEELSLLGPFIDLIIEGKAPPLNQYYNTSPAILRPFKDRMQVEGLWPQSHTPKRVAVVPTIDPRDSVRCPPWVKSRPLRCDVGCYPTS